MNNILLPVNLPISRLIRISNITSKKVTDSLEYQVYQYQVKGDETYKHAFTELCQAQLKPAEKLSNDTSRMETKYKLILSK